MTFLNCCCTTQRVSEQNKIGIMVLSGAWVLSVITLVCLCSEYENLNFTVQNMAAEAVLILIGMIIVIPIIIRCVLCE